MSIKWDGNIQNVLFCCGHKCLRTSLDNTRHAPSSDSYVISWVQRFLSPCTFEELHFTSSLRLILMISVFLHKLSVTFLPSGKGPHFMLPSKYSRRPAQNMLSQHVFVFQFLPDVKYSPSLSRVLTLFKSGCSPKTFLWENIQCVTYSRAPPGRNNTAVPT